MYKHQQKLAVSAAVFALLAGCGGGGGGDTATPAPAAGTPVTTAPVVATPAPAAVAPVTTAPVVATPAPVTAAPVTTAPVIATPAPVTPAPVTTAPVVVTPVPVTTAPVAPIPTPTTSASAAEIADCFKMGPTAFSYATGTKAPDGTIAELIRTDVTPAAASSATPNQFTESTYSPVSTGGSYKSAETTYQLTALGLQRLTINTYSATGAITGEFFNYSGYMPTVLSLGVEQRYSENFSNKLAGSSLVLSTSGNIQSVKLLSVEPLVTAGKTFSSACQVQMDVINANGRVIPPGSSTSIVWFAKNFGAVKGSTASAAALTTGTELVRVITPPSP
jgi:hypothetical protein